MQKKVATKKAEGSRKLSDLSPKRVKGGDAQAVKGGVLFAS